HVGGARTALFNWLFARARGGTFILRIEDTDRARSSEEMTSAILDGLAWLGLELDEGPFFQAEGIDRHRADAWALFETGAAYRCFCTPEQLALRREEARRTGSGHGYDGRCRAVDAAESGRRAEGGEPFALRVRIPDGVTAWEDLIHGEISFDSDSVDDFIVLRSDGTPVYNLAVVSDDFHAGVTHVIRGDDHISNTPKQIAIYRALGRPLPVFGHVPLILGTDGKRLSKRHGAMSVLAYEEMGFLPAGMVNFLALLGWSPGGDREVMSADELVEAFSVDRILKKSAVFDLEKLEWLNGQHIAASPARDLAPMVVAALSSEGVDEVDVERLDAVIDLVKNRPRTVPALVGQVRPFVVDDVEFEQSAVDRFWKRPAEAAELLRALAPELEGVADRWNEETLEGVIRGLADRLEVGAGRLINPLRVALMGQGVSPGIFEVVETMGPDRVARRIAFALGYLDAKAVAG
ncbi:MAG: glutamate--tRNA ligase, partial [Gemmatimonadota bacterium]|nr:glutamate--tRNA ligase [Gemmatimonadota bacterium]